MNDISQIFYSVNRVGDFFNSMRIRNFMQKPIGILVILLGREKPTVGHYQFECEIKEAKSTSLF